ncbi:MAG: thioredoxin family protein [Hyphomicrobiaceae bacterium]|nr:thioredoxin family protein [Hyphomicrobiaceae bacterium]
MNLLKKAGFVGQGSAFVLLFLVLVPAQASAGSKELVMFGSRGCVYCQVFNRKVAPGYRRSKIGHRAPLKEIDINRHGTGGYALRGGPITVTPTFVMFKRGREVARIKGYPGKKNFYRLVRRILSRVK